ncbi:MAG: hypothetical protein HY722_15345 [Planctomycetes bacterium]|nr:hypothetical protein [Planctomycetota bacterium]
MRLLGNFTLQDYVTHFRNRDDYYHRSCLERANELLFKRVGVLAAVLVLALGSAWATFGLVTEVEAAGRRLDEAAAEGVVLKSVLGELSPEQVDRVRDRLKGADPAELQRLREVYERERGGR